MIDDQWIDFERALELTLGAVEALPGESAPLLELTGRVTATAVTARVDAPSTDVSLKDGYAVRSVDITTASAGAPRRLLLRGSAAAGRSSAGEVLPGSAVRVLSGASIPPGADAVLADEFARTDGDAVLALAGAEAGRNILARGTDITAGEPLLAAGALLRPAQVGLLAANGYTCLDVVRRPRVGIIAIGDELVAPGDTLGPGMIYTSNQATIAAWCAHFGMRTEVAVARDDGPAIAQAILEAEVTCDALITTGGAWSSERDLVVGALETLKWRKLYHHVKLGPGKGVGCGLLRGKPVFCLPGGPPSCHTAFLQLALPALLKMAGRPPPQLPWLMAELGEEARGQSDWTQFIEGRLVTTATGVRFEPRKLSSRLQSMAAADALVMIPSGTAAIPRGAVVPAQVLPDALLAVSETTPTGLPLLPAHRPAGSGADQARPLPPVVSFVARSGSGKTTFLEQLIPELTARGLRVGALKHHGHATPFDAPGKDTFRLAQAGAQIVVGACSVQVAVFRQEDGAADLDAIIARHLMDVDLVVTEGYKRGPYPKIEVHRRAHNPDLLCEGSELLALVTDEALDLGVPQFGLTDFGDVAAFLCDWARHQR